MKLTPREKDKLLIAMAAEVARKRLARGMIHDVQVEATFPDGTKLVTVHNPIR